jgi:hypothetical protein
MLQQLPHLPLQHIFHFLSLDDIIHLTKVPEIRYVVLDFYKREENKKDLIHRSLVDTIQSIFIPSHVLWYYKKYGTNYVGRQGRREEFDFILYYFLNKGFQMPQILKQIKEECIRGFTNEEILNIRGGIQLDVISEKIAYICNNYNFTDLYNFIDDLDIDNTITYNRREELYSIVYNSEDKYEACFSKSLIQFVNEYLLTNNGFERTLSLIEYIFEWIYDIYQDTMKNTLVFPPIFIKKGIPIQYKNFIQEIDKILKTFLFYS